MDKLDIGLLELPSSAIPIEVGASGRATREIPFGSVFSHINNSLTSIWDGLFGPDEVDSLDASCNTCKHFQRKPMTSEEKAERNIYGMPGFCALKQIPTTGWQRGQFCGFENGACYENRRTGMHHKEACVLSREPKEEA